MEKFTILSILKKLIKQGYQFETKSDTEVLIKAFDFYNEKVCEELEGMWSFAIFNKKSNKLFISRDRFGEKPLYLMKCNHGIYFGSEINYIKNLSGIRLNLNLNKFKNFLKYGYNSFLDNETFFKSYYVKCFSISLTIKEIIELINTGLKNAKKISLVRN